MKKFFIPCEEANHVCDKNQYKEASFTDLIKLNLHLLYCSVCRKYSMRNGKLSKLFNNNATQLDASIKQNMQRDIEAELKKNNY